MRFYPKVLESANDPPPLTGHDYHHDIDHRPLSPGPMGHGGHGGHSGHGGHGGHSGHGGHGGHGGPPPPSYNSRPPSSVSNVVFVSNVRISAHFVFPFIKHVISSFYYLMLQKMPEFSNCREHKVLFILITYSF